MGSFIAPLTFFFLSVTPGLNQFSGIDSAPLCKELVLQLESLVRVSKASRLVVLLMSTSLDWPEVIPIYLLVCQAECDWGSSCIHLQTVFC